MNKYSNGKIYKIINNVNDKIYVGSTCQILCKRLVNHKFDCKRRNSPWYISMRQIGNDKFKIILLKNFPCNNKEELEAEEYKIIKELKEKGEELYNDFIGCHSTEAKIKMSEAHKGKIHTEETKNKMSELHRRENLSEETIKKMSEARKGRTYTIETIKKMSEAHKKENLSGETINKMSEAHKGKKNNFNYGCVCFHKNNKSWCFKWSENNKQNSISFSIKKYGEEEAKNLCELKRKSIYPEYNPEEEYQNRFTIIE